jgi:probable DNA metabolism protein
MDPTAHQHIELNGGADLQGFRQALRILSGSNIPHEQITWHASAAPEHFGGGHMPAAYGAAGKPIILPRQVADLIKLVVCHTDSEKYALLYELVWRMRRPTNPEPHIYEVAADKLVTRLTAMAEAVRRDLHNMHASVHFREVNDPAIGSRFVAWFEPDHYIIEEAAQFFVDRFASIDWTILTPKGSLWWDKAELAIGPPGSRAEAPEADAAEIRWRTHYESTFNPARTSLNQMRPDMPRKGWRKLDQTLDTTPKPSPS